MARIKKLEAAGLIGSGLDLSTFRTEEDLAAAIRERLKGIR